MANSEPVVIASDQSALPVSDNGGSLTIDGSVTVSGTVTANAGTGTMNVSVQNASIPVTDNGGSLTIDGSVSVSNLPTIQDINLKEINGSAVSVDTGITDIGTQRVILATDQTTIPVNDNGGSLTIDGTVELGATTLANVFDVSVTNASIPVTDNGGSLTIDGTVTASQATSTAWRVQISDGTSDVPIDAAHADGETNTENHIDVGAKGLVFNGTSWDRMRGDTTGQYVVGNIAHDTADTGNPVKIGFQAEGTNFPAAVASGDRVNGIADVFGRQLIGTIDASMQVWKSANYTTQQTGATMWTPSGGKKICVTYLAISSYGTTAGRVLVWFGAAGDTTYTAGTDQLVWGGSFAPSANANPGAIVQLPFGLTAVNADYHLKITTDAAISLDVTIYGYEC
jgi:hypothetical protein